MIMDSIALALHEVLERATIEAGATAVVQPGGSMRDDDVIAAADEHDIAMIFTGTRDFQNQFDENNSVIPAIVCDVS